MCDGQKGEGGRREEERDKARGKASKSRKIKKSFSKNMHFSLKSPLRRTAMPLEVLQSSPAITTCLLLKQTYYGRCLTCCHLVELASRLRLNKG